MTIRGTGDSFGERFTREWRNPSWSKLIIASPWMLGAVLLTCVSIVRYEIAGRQETAPGQITVNQPEDDRYGYVFAVNGRRYEGSGKLPNQPTLGQQVTVYFDPKDPETNSLTDFTELSLETLGPVLFMALGSSMVVAVILFLRRSARRRVLVP